ncbi:unnamed protein product [Rotaria sordida]|uniref:Uncharacterized protein n=1 Tax=Rotaria sordida TaxID=392033 RepID=A0A815HSX1_9BILA|nr:unnamed protein product [Rotaria sordida]
MLNFKILLSSIDVLAKTDITDIVVLDILRQSRIQHMMLVGRRRRIQILSFTIKKFRELTKLTDLQSIILLSSIDDLAKTDITDIVVLDILHQSRIQHMILIGRRRRIQISSFTIKEFRELTKLTDLQSILNKDFN